MSQKESSNTTQLKDAINYVNAVGVSKRGQHNAKTCIIKNTSQNYDITIEDRLKHYN